ncbi:hypothetical protein LTS10_013320 [Elasticomyces elasticus]|nr:hypothetical protein LTS10_013320 [Elasticomyces elasticus]
MWPASDFGDSEIDLPMLKGADQAVVVVGDEVTRSKNMNGHLRRAISQSGLQVHQTLVAGSSMPRLLDLPEERPLVDLWKQHTIASFTKRHLPILAATESTAAKLLQTAMRDAVINTGQSIIIIVERVRKLKPDIRIVVVAGVVHVEASQYDQTIWTRVAGCGKREELNTDLPPWLEKVLAQGEDKL